MHIINRTILLALFLCCGCTATGPTYSEIGRQATTADKSKAVLVIYRPSSFAWAARSPNIEINGIPACDLPNASFFVKDIDVTQFTIATSLWDMPGTSRLTLTPKRGAKYYIRISSDGGKVAAGVFAGWIGLVAGEAASSHAGPFTIDVLDEQTALPELESLRMNGGCH